MAGMTFRTLLVHGEDASSNDGMVDELSRSGALRNQACIRAFRAVDRGYFWVEGAGVTAYADTPVRHGRLHQSAPHIYARALEALMPLQPGMSFLNIGSGTGYFSSLVAELVGPESFNDGIDIWPETVEHAKDRVRKLGRHNIEFSIGNVYELDVNLCMRYDRIYIGACASQRAEYLYELLEIGGILVAPYQTGFSQQLRKVVRESEKKFRIEVLNSVHFAPLVEPPPAPGAAALTPSAASGEGDDSASSTVETVQTRTISGLPGVPFTFALRQRPWTLERTWAYPERFRNVVQAVLTARALDHAALCLPAELWQSHILPWCPRWWFEPEVAPPPSAPARALSAIARAGETVKRVLLRSRRLGSGHDLELEGQDEEEVTEVVASISTTSTMVPTDSEPTAEPGPEDEGAGVTASLLPQGRRPPSPRGAGRGLGPEVGVMRRIWRCLGRCCQVVPWDCLRWGFRRATGWRGDLGGTGGRGSRGRASVPVPEDEHSFNVL